MTAPREIVDLLRTVDKLHIDASNPVPTYVFVAIEEAVSTIERLVEALDEMILCAELPGDDNSNMPGAIHNARRALTGGE